MKNLPIYLILILAAICISCSEGSDPMGTGGGNSEDLYVWEDPYYNDTTDVDCVCRLVIITTDTETNVSITEYGEDEIRDCDDELYYIDNTIILGNIREKTTLECD